MEEDGRDTEENGESHREKEDKDSAIDLSKEMEELGNLQISLEKMVNCSNSPSTSLSSIRISPRETTTAQTSVHSRRLIRVPCTDESTYSLPFTVYGGSSVAKLILIDIVRRDDLIGVLCPNDRLLSVEDIDVSGMICSEVTRILEKFCFEREQIAIEIIPAGGIPDDIRQILADSEWTELQKTIRDNLYQKTVPYTTRTPREGEIDGEHYRFVSTEEFNRVEKEGGLLEHGTYQGHLYGTPRPSEVFPHTMVSMSAKGPLPPNWEIGYAENGDKYFIDHNNGTTSWDDPRELPTGWEQVEDPEYGTFYVDHINKKTQYERPPTQGVVPQYESIPTTNGYNAYNGVNGISKSEVSPQLSYNSEKESMFTKHVEKLRGELISTTIVKGAKGLGFTLIGNDPSSRGDEFIQVKSILSGGPAHENGILRSGDVLVRVNGELLLGATQSDACRIFVSIPVGDPVAIQVCRGYPLLLDPSNRIITENVYATGGRSRDLQEIEIFKGNQGFGFTIADSVSGQRVKKILYPAQCPNLLEGDTIVELDGKNVRAIPHTQLVDMLRECAIGHRGRLMVRRSSPKHRSRTPTAAFRYGEQRGTPAPVQAPRSKTPAPDTATTQSQASTLQRQPNMDDGTISRMRPSMTSLGFATPNYMPISAFQTERQSETITVNLIRKPNGFGFRLLGGKETNTVLTVGQIVANGAASDDGRLHEGDEIIEIDGQNVVGANHNDAVALLEQAARNKHVKMVVRRPKTELSHSLSMPNADRALSSIGNEYDVTLTRNDVDGFGFIIISSLNRNGSTIGQILDNSPASRSGRLRVGDRVVAVNGIDILNLSHGEIVSLIKASGLSVRLTIAGTGDAPLATSTLTRSQNGTSNYKDWTPNYNTIGSNYSTNQSTVRNTNYAPYSTLGQSVTPTPNSVLYSTVGKVPPPPNSALYSTVGPRTPAPYSTVGTAPPQRNSALYSSMSEMYGRPSNGVNEPVPPQQDGEVMGVELERGNKGFGFSIRGGHEFGAMPLFVLRIADDGPAAADGRLRVGDQLISINSCDTKGLTHEEAIQLIKQHPTVRLTVRRHKLP